MTYNSSSPEAKKALTTKMLKNIIHNDFGLSKDDIKDMLKEIALEAYAADSPSKAQLANEIKQRIAPFFDDRLNNTVKEMVVEYAAGHGKVGKTAVGDAIERAFVTAAREYINDNVTIDIGKARLNFDTDDGS